MEISTQSFLTHLAGHKVTHTERAVALLWFLGLSDPAICVSASDLAAAMHDAGYARQNVSRLRLSLKKDKRTAMCSGGLFRIKISEREGLDSQYSDLARHHPVKDSSSVLPVDLFAGSRGYIEKVVHQVNASFDFGLFDCCAVMCRRLVETLIIEGFEYKGIEEEIKGDDGHYLMLSGLLSKVESNPAFSLSRNGKQGLRSIKDLGDLSAHNRRYNARKNDIERVRDKLRVTSEELLKIAGFS